MIEASQLIQISFASNGDWKESIRQRDESFARLKFLPNGDPPCNTPLGQDGIAYLTYTRSWQKLFTGQNWHFVFFYNCFDFRGMSLYWKSKMKINRSRNNSTTKTFFCLFINFQHRDCEHVFATCLLTQKLKML